MKSLGKHTTVVVALLAAMNCVDAAGKLWCKDRLGKEVDWYVAYKLPKLQTTKWNFMTPRGEELAYYDSRMISGFWNLYPHSVYSEYNPIAYTMERLYSKTLPEDIAYVAYNDQVPPGFNGTRNGHTKGILIVGKESVVWLQHSVPRFPPRLHGGKYHYPDSGRENAQLFVCTTYPVYEANVIARTLRLQYANVYQSHGPNAIVEKHPELKLLLQGKFITSQQNLEIDLLRSKRGLPMWSITKRGTWKHCVYTRVVTAVLQDNIAVESWRNGAGGKLEVSCRPDYSVYDVQDVRLHFSRVKAIQFSYKKDHSKWAVAARKSYFCSSSLNRMESQFNRGGQVMCMMNLNLATLFRNSIANVSLC